MTQLREKLAALCHEQWTGWMTYLFLQCDPPVDGHITIPRESVAWWQRQMHSDYADLSEAEKDSDRKEADRILEIVSADTVALQTKLGEIIHRAEMSAYDWMTRAETAEKASAILRAAMEKIAANSDEENEWDAVEKLTVNGITAQTALTQATAKQRELV